MAIDFRDYCEPYTWSGTAKVAVTGNPSVRLAGFQLNSLTSAGAGVVNAKDASATGQHVYYNTAGAAMAKEFLSIPIRVGDLYMSAASASLTAFECTLYIVKD